MLWGEREGGREGHLQRLDLCMWMRGASQASARYIKNSPKHPSFRKHCIMHSISLVLLLLFLLQTSPKSQSNNNNRQISNYMHVLYFADDGHKHTSLDKLGPPNTLHNGLFVAQPRLAHEGAVEAGAEEGVAERVGAAEVEEFCVEVSMVGVW